MADITITAISQGAQATTYERVQAGEALTLGYACYRLASTNKYHHADCTTSAVTAEMKGFITAAVALDGYDILIKSGPIVVTLSSGTLTQGEAYYLSEAGLLMPHADLTASDYVTYVGQAQSTTILDVDIKPYGWVKT